MCCSNTKPTKAYDNKAIKVVVVRRHPQSIAATSSRNSTNNNNNNNINSPNNAITSNNNNNTVVSGSNCTCSEQLSAFPKNNAKNKIKNNKNKKTNNYNKNKNNKYIRIENLPERTHPEKLLKFLNETMRQTNLCYFYETPVRNCLISGCVAYLTMENPTMAREIISTLDGIHYLGSALNIGNLYRTKTNARTSNKGGKEEEKKEPIGKTITEDKIWIAQTQADLDEMAESLLCTCDSLSSGPSTRTDSIDRRRQLLRETAKQLIRASSQICE